MLFPWFARRILLAAGVTLCVLSAVGDVQASCGDWLAEPHSDMHDSDLNAMESGDLSADKPGSETPCHGPACRNAPKQPAAPVPAPKTGSNRDLVAVTLKNINDLSDLYVSSLCEKDATASKGYQQEIEHPPRV